MIFLVQWPVEFLSHYRNTNIPGIVQKKMFIRIRVNAVPIITTTRGEGHNSRLYRSLLEYGQKTKDLVPILLHVFPGLSDLYRVVN